MLEFIKNLVKREKGYRKWLKYRSQIAPITYEGQVPFADWEATFKKYIIENGYRWGEARNILEFCSCQLECIKSGSFENKVDSEDPILVCVEKNDLTRIKELYAHYRKQGVKKFVIVDNMSTDGTLEFLKQQEDTDIWLAKDPYSSTMRQAWVNRIYSWYGYHRWFYVVDSDEYCVYDGCETEPIHALVKFCKKNHYKALRGIMLDMYAKEDVSNLDENDEFRKVCTYFDGEGYYQQKNRFFSMILGGMRNRVMETPALLTKYPLFYFEKGLFEESAHYRSDYKTNHSVPCLMGILHYKFTNKKDIDKIKDRVKNGNYYKGSLQYGEYLKNYEKTGRIDLYYEKSIAYIDSSSLKKTGLFDQWKK